MRARRVDNCQAAIVAALRQAGASVLILNSTIDLAIGFRGVNWLADCKSPRGKPTAAQRRLEESWRGQFCYLRTVDEALALIGVISD